MMFEAILQSEGLAELDVSRGEPTRLCVCADLGPDQMNRFLFAVRAIYHAPNPYHNYVHAIDVLQATYVFLATLELVPSFDYIRSWKPRSAPWRPSAGRKRSSAALRGGAAVPAVPGAPSNQGAQDTDGWSIGAKCAQEVVRPQDVLAILIAAIVHDIGHPGLSNAFMVSRSCLHALFWPFTPSLSSFLRAAVSLAVVDLENGADWNRRKMPKRRCVSYTTTNLYSKTCTAFWPSNCCGNTDSVSYSIHRLPTPNCRANKHWSTREASNAYCTLLSSRRTCLCISPGFKTYKISVRIWRNVRGRVRRWTLMSRGMRGRGLWLLRRSSNVQISATRCVSPEIGLCSKSCKKNSHESWRSSTKPS